jgi:hypothetical protein
LKFVVKVNVAREVRMPCRYIYEYVM